MRISIETKVEPFNPARPEYASEDLVQKALEACIYLRREPLGNLISVEVLKIRFVPGADKHQVNIVFTVEIVLTERERIPIIVSIPGEYAQAIGAVAIANRVARYVKGEGRLKFAAIQDHVKGILAELEQIPQ